MDPDEVEEIKRYSPNGTKSLRACIRCRLVMTREQFYNYGCPTCRGVLDMAGNDGRVLGCTSANFQGFITLIRPGAFLSRYNGLENRRPGCYALTVQGKIPDYILHETDLERDEDVRSTRSSRRSSKRQRPGTIGGSPTAVGSAPGSRDGTEAESDVEAPPPAKVDEEEKEADFSKHSQPSLDLDNEDAPLLGNSNSAHASPRLSALPSPASEISFSTDPSGERSGERSAKKKRRLEAKVSSASSAAASKEADALEAMLEPEGEGQE